MYCKKCGRQIADEMVFCIYCGEKQGVVSNDISEKKKNRPVGRKVKAGALAGGAAVIVAAVAMFLAFRGDRLEKKPASAVEDAAVENTQMPLYDIQDVGQINLTAQNHTPMGKQPGMAWDSTLFYWLEDIDPSSAEDGNIAGCRLTKTLLRNDETGQLIRYEVYSNLESGEIYKIVSIEETDGGLRLTDYYYKNGSPDFIFQREDTVYTPTYATIEKTGERYYFNNEVMVRWRFIREPGVVGEYTLAPEEVWYVQSDYFAESEEVRRAYDDKEREMLNAAHNTYDAVTGSGSIGLVEGCVQDTAGNGMAGRKIRMYRMEDGVFLYEAVTNEAGEYSFFVYLDGTDCYMKAEGDGEYREASMQGINLGPSSTAYTCSLTLHRDSGDEYPVDIRAYSCRDIAPEGEALQTVTAVFREGAGNYGGKAVCTVETQDGIISVTLSSGIYTVQLSVEGYMDSYMEVEVLEHAAVGDAYLMPVLGEGQTGILLTWEGSGTDLDLTLFTPYRAENGDMAHIGGAVDCDSHGNMLVSDNSNGCEAMFLETGTQGIYKVYVNDYTDSLAGNYNSDVLHRLNVHIYIYNSDGLAAAYTLPIGQNGVVWEVAEISGRNVTPSQRLYTNISGKEWWTADKETIRTAEDKALLEKLRSRESGSLINLMEVLLHFMSEEEINMLLRGELEGIEAFYDLEGVYAPAVELSWVVENAAGRELVEKLNKQRGIDNNWWEYLTEQQAEYLLRSINGKQTDIDFTGYAGWVEPYIGLSFGATVVSWLHFEARSLERVAPNVWEITGYSVLEYDAIPPEVYRVCFTVVRNPDSCFDGYSLIHCEVEEDAPTNWAQVYYDYLTTDTDFLQMLSGMSEDDMGHMWIHWYYIDDDMIPELCLEVSVPYGYKTLLYIGDGEVQSTGGSVEFSLEVKPFTGFFKEATGMTLEMPEYYSYLNDGKITYLGTRYLNGYEEGNILYSLGEAEYGEANATKEEFEEAMKNFMGTENWEFNDDEYECYYFTSDYNETLTILQELVSRKNT